MKINYKLITILLILSIIFLTFKVLPILSTYFIYIKQVLNPLLISLLVSYFIYPVVKFFNKKLSKTLSILFTILLVIIILFIMFYFSFPIIFNELENLLKELTKILPKILKNIDSDLINKILSTYTKDISTLSFSFINKLVSIIINISMIIVMTISFLINMDKIRGFVYKKISNKRFKLLIIKIDNDLYYYVKSFMIIIVIEIIEYTIIYFIVGHPYYYLLGFLIGVSSVIPYLGALFTNLIAFITAVNVSNRLFVFTSLISLFLPIINNYLLEPKIMSKEVKIPFIFIIISIIISSKIFGFIGLILSVPIYIVISNIIKYIFSKEE